MQTDRFVEMREYIRKHARIKKELIDFGILVLRLKVSEANETIEELESIPIDDIH